MTLRDRLFIKALESGTLPKEAFDHTAHLRLAWIALEEKGQEEGIKMVRQKIKTYITHLGAQEKYHETLTVAAVKTVHYFKQKKPELSFEKFINTFPRLVTSFEDLLYQHYSSEVLGSSASKHVFVEPDLLAYP